MLAKMSELLAIAEQKNCAIGMFNTPNLEQVLAVIHTAETLNVPVMIAHLPLFEESAPIHVLVPAMLAAAKAARVPVCVHLDHCEDLAYMEEALKLGVTSVMYDGSLLPYEENLANTRKAAEMAHSCGVDIEAELGAMPAREGGLSPNPTGPVYTDPAMAVEFCRETGIDALAPSFGTAHGIYKSKPVLDLALVKTIYEKTGLPLVMHGGSGVSHEDYRTAIQNGIRKVNYYSYMSRAGAGGVKELISHQDVTFFLDIADAARKAMEANVEEAMRVFYGL
ncbi:MAG: class II fructose-bisphosphate aldolase [Ruminococcaceae bacterium]|nr:class II fructose-bisphosphate aldolase [Oscillospiraceae bacterium]